jgi:GAF domain-containing protein
MPDPHTMQVLCGQLDRREISPQELMEGCTRLITSVIGCTRAGIWLFEDNLKGRRLRCLCLYDGAQDQTLELPDETSETVGAYFRALQETGYVLASDVTTHPATAGLYGGRFNVTGVRSLMAVSFAVNGRLYGAFTCTQVGRTVNWTTQQLALLMRLGGRASLALAGATATEQLTRPMRL